MNSNKRFLKPIQNCYTEQKVVKLSKQLPSKHPRYVSYYYYRKPPVIWISFIGPSHIVLASGNGGHRFILVGNCLGFYVLLNDPYGNVNRIEYVNGTWF